METTKLPKNPSALIRHALRDLALCEADSRYSISLNDYHSPLESDSKQH